MVRRYLILTLVFSVVLLGLPSLAFAARDSNESATAAMHDCVCPPGHEMPPTDDSNGSNDSAPCAPTLGCMIHCGMAPMGMTTDIAGTVDTVARHHASVLSDVGPADTSSFPPFRPPSR